MTDEPREDKAIYYEALAIQDPGRRAAYLDLACGENTSLRRIVQELLDADSEAGDFLLHSPLESAMVTATEYRSESGEPEIGSKIGPYKLLEKIGEGGFGIVYMAEQLQPMNRRVALKILKPGMDTKQIVARFEAERQALALMEHENIAKVFAAGATERGRPYFAMELVRGVPITEYCDDRGMSTEDRLRLFMVACSGIQHAHQKGIIHRDIKPNNILVTNNGDEPVPKIIDFGIAKATQGRLTDKTLFTNFRQFIGTPAYMSPEQAQLSAVDVDTRSDIYSMGVLLYELLTGRTPLDSAGLKRSSFEELCRRIREEEPAKPSTRVNCLTNDDQQTLARDRRTDFRRVATELRGDLDWIVMKSIEKDRSRRYASASELRSDVECYLNAQPVSAAAPSSLYLMAKFVRRNRNLIAAGTVMIGLLIAGTVVSVSQAIRANRNSVLADQRATDAKLSESRATSARNAATAAESREREQRVRAEQLKYSSDIMVALEAFQSADLARIKEILERHIPKPGEVDLRGWEWHFLYGAVDTQSQRVDCGALFIDGLAVSNDAKLIAMSCKKAVMTKTNGQNRSKDVRFVDLYSADNLELVDSFPGTQGWCGGLRFTKEGTELVIEDSTIRRINLQTRDEHQWQTDEDEIGRLRPVELTVDGQYVLGLEQIDVDKPHVVNRRIVCFDAEKQEKVGATEAYFLPDPFHLEREFIASPDGRFIALSCTKRKLRIFSIPDLKLLATITTPGDTDTIAWSSDSTMLATGYSYPWQVDLWKVDEWSHIAVLAGSQTSPCESISFSEDGDLVAFSEMRSRMHVWNLQSKSEEKVILISANVIRFMPGREQLACATDDGNLNVIDLMPTGDSDLHRLSRLEEYWNLDYSPDGTLLGVSSSDGKVRLFDPVTERLVATFGAATEKPETPVGQPHARLKFAPNGRFLVVDNNDYTAGVFDVLSREHKFNVEHSGLLFDLDVSADSQLIATAGIDRAAIFWDANTGDEAFRITEAPNIKIDSIRFLPTGPLAVIGVNGRGRKELAIVDLRRQECIQRTVVKTYYWSLNFSPDGKRLFAGADGFVDVYDFPSLKKLQPIKGRGGPILNISFASDGTLAIPSWGGHVQLWSQRLNAEVGHLPLPVDWMTSAKFSPKGRSLAVSTKSNGVFLFRAPSFVKRPLNSNH